MIQPFLSVMFPVCWNDILTADKGQGWGDGGFDGEGGLTPSRGGLALSLIHLHLCLASGLSLSLGSCLQSFLTGLSGTPGNADCDKSLDCLFELSGMHLNLNVLFPK